MIAPPALIWTWSYERPANADGPAVAAFGNLTTTRSPDANGFYTINLITGQRNSITVSGLMPTGSVAPGNCLDASTCFASDNLLRPRQGGRAQLSSNGFNVAYANGTYANYFFASFLAPPAYLEFYSVPPFGFIPPGGPQPPDSELTGAFQAAPIPGPLPVAGVLSGLGWARRLRRQSRQVGEGDHDQHEQQKDAQGPGDQQQQHRKNGRRHLGSGS